MGALTFCCAALYRKGEGVRGGLLILGKCITMVMKIFESRLKNIFTAAVGIRWMMPPACTWGQTPIWHAASAQGGLAGVWERLLLQVHQQPLAWGVQET